MLSQKHTIPITNKPKEKTGSIIAEQVHTRRCSFIALEILLSMCMPIPIVSSLVYRGVRTYTIIPYAVLRQKDCFTAMYRYKC